MDEVFVRRAVENADLNAMRVALLQATGDPEIAAIRAERIAVRAGAGSNYVVAEKDRPQLIDKAVDFLLKGAPRFTPSVPTDAQLHALMEFAAGGTRLSEQAFEVRKPLLAFDDYPRFAKWPEGVPGKIPPGFVVAIVGAGFSGLGMAVQLEVLGIPYVIFERRSEIGGTWSINTYPDARVDTPSAVYEFSFEKRYPWTEHFARQAEVRAYLEHVARKYGVYEKIRFNHDVEGGAFDPKTSRWELNVIDAEGRPARFEANFVISGAGLFSTPRKLDVEGIDTFEGEVVHSTSWTTEHSTKGKSIAVIGNGSTGVQLLRKASEQAKQTYVFQRTPQWISPRERYGEPVTPEERWLLDTMPYYWNWVRYTGAFSTLDFYALMVPDPDWQASGGQFNQRNDAVRAFLCDYIKTQCEGRQDLIDKLTPDYAPFARRLVIDNGWYRALLKENVELVTDPIERFTRTGVVTGDGKERYVDLVIASIGFSVEKYIWPADYVGPDGIGLQQRWNDGARAYLGMMVPGLPNFFMLFGPNSLDGVGEGGTLPKQVEMWAGYVAQAIMMVLRRNAQRIEVRPLAYEQYNRRLDESSQGLIWLAEGPTARNYWVRGGKLQVNYPWPHDEMHRLLRAPDLDDLIIA